MPGPAVKPVTIIGAGLAGCEAAWQVSTRGLPVRLFEMKPALYSPAHRSPGLAELVCSNSFRSESPDSAVGILKHEMTMMNSLIMEAAAACRVPAGKALAVDRELFSAYVEDRLRSLDTCLIERVEITDIPDDIPLVIASGPLTSEKLAGSIAQLTGST
ncbi:MAG TPA: FAD-binding protein, partial [Deltaproteobacteria bacterium]|nr:FAD-binding protein [Deltaproteobacteria bacterium]